MKNLSFCFILFLLVCLSLPMITTAQTVDIPDPNLRAAIETALNKASGAPITAGEMETLTFFEAPDVNIRVLTGLEYATNLRFLFLWDNSISDLTPLAGSINLRFLDLQGNSISDLSPAMGLTNLIFLGLWRNSVSELSPLVENTGLGTGDGVVVEGNLLNYPSIYTHIPALQGRGVEVLFDSRTSTGPLKISGDDQNGTVDVGLAQPLVIEVRDENGAVFEGVPVMFTVTAGSGTLQPEITMTDADGRAESSLTLGSDPGINTVEVSVEEITETVTFNAVAKLLEFDLSVPSGLSLIHIPLKVRVVDGMAAAIESVADLYNVLGGADTVNFLITYDPAMQEWRSYFGVSDKGTAADKGLTDDIGILAGMGVPVSIRLGGDALGTNGSSTITLSQGLNLVGVPLMDSRITRVSDLFALEEIMDNISAIIVSDNGNFKVVGRAGDDGDISVTGGGAFILAATGEATVSISGDGWDNITAGTMAAPPLAMTSISTSGATPVLALSGTIVDEMRHTNNAGIRVMVKNLSTGSTVATVIGETASPRLGYQLTVVDIEKGQAASIGDVLEIFATSPDVSVAIQPLRYTVTADDVRRSRVELPVLSLQEIPAETELLRNYPNPFNPETWIPYRLAEDAFVTLTIYDDSGQVIRTLDVGHRIAAVYENRARAVYWDGRNEFGEQVASGVYFYTLTAGDYSATRKMVILK